MRKLYLTVVALLVAAPTGPMLAADDPIKVGLSNPLTGPIPYIGEFTKKAAEMSVDEINDQGGIAGRPVELISYDNECSPEKATSVAERLVSRDNVDVLRGAICSGASLATLPIVAREGIPMVIAESASLKIKEQIGIGGNEWGFRFNIDDEHRAIGNAYQLIELLDLKRFVYLGPNNDWGRAGGIAYKEWIPKMGGELVLDEYFDPEAEDFMGYLTKYKRMDIDGLIVLGTPRQTAPLFRQAHGIGLKDTVTIAATGGSLASKTIELAGKDVMAGLVAATSWAPDAPNPMNKEFVEKFTERYGEAPILEAAQTYVANQITFEAMRQAISEAGKLSPEALREALEQTDMETAFGRIRFNLHHQGYQDLYITEATDTGDISIIEVVPAQRLVELTSQ